MNNKLKYLVIHCTATPPEREVTKEDLHEWHIVNNGWSRMGYSDLIHLDGSLTNLHKWDNDGEVDSWEITNGVRGFNGVARHVCYVGGLDDKGNNADTRTNAQVKSLATYVKMHVLMHPDIKVAGHNYFANKGCPCFDWQNFCLGIGIPKKNIAGCY